MWYPASVTVAVASEPISAADVKAQSRIDFDDDDALLDRLITVAREYVERYCNATWATRTVEIKCDAFADFDRLPLAPVASISSVSYVDSVGVTQTLGADVYEERLDDMEASIVLKYGQVWPAIRPGSRITVTAVLGADLPAPVKHAMLVHIAESYENREPVEIDGRTTFDNLLSNFRRGA